MALKFLEMGFSSRLSTRLDLTKSFNRNSRPLHALPVPS